MLRFLPTAARRARGVRRASEPPQMMKGMLVLELASVLAGPSAGQFLAELGAEVIKVENAGTEGDVTRKWKLVGEEVEQGVTAYFSCANLGKRSLAVDARKEEGLRLIQRLAAKADVVVASYKPGDAEKLRLDPVTLRELNPRLVYGQITGYGLKDPRPGFDAVIQAECGLQYMNGEPDSPPTKMPVAMTDLLASHQLKQGILLALWQRDRTGEGCVVDVSLMESGVSALANQGTGYLLAGAVPQRLGSDHPSICPYGSVFETGDGKPLVLGIGADAQWRQLCDLLGAPELGTDPRFKTNPLRVQHRAECKAQVAALIKAQPSRAALLRGLAERRVPGGAVNDMSAVFEEPLAQGVVVRGEGAEAQGIRQAVCSYHGMPPQGSIRPPPGYGAHSAEVLREHLGIPVSEFDRLAEAGVVVRGS
eukprot:Hpha_TRINITY_DN22831_c0_g1::TRINITY_DN22831_c0_g1_i1::g.84322::m.84322